MCSVGVTIALSLFCIVKTSQSKNMDLFHHATCSNFHFCTIYTLAKALSTSILPQHMSSGAISEPRIVFERYKGLSYGGNGNISIGLDQKYASKFRNSREDPAAEIMYSLIVKKECYTSKAAIESMEKEVKALKHIRESTISNQEYCDKFSQLIDSESFLINGNQAYIYLHHIAGINLRDYRDSYTHQSGTGSPSCLKEPNEMLKPMSISAVRVPMIFRIFSEVLLAMIFMHEKMKMAHGDIKADNIIIRETKPLELGLPEVALIDFGSAVLEKDDAAEYQKKVALDRLDFFRVMVDLVRDHRSCGEMRCRNEAHVRPDECLKHRADCDNWYNLGCDRAMADHVGLWGWDSFCEDIEKGVKLDVSMIGPWFEVCKQNWLKFATEVGEGVDGSAATIGRELTSIIESDDYKGKNISIAEVSHGIENCGRLGMS